MAEDELAKPQTEPGAEPVRKPVPPPVVTNEETDVPAPSCAPPGDMMAIEDDADEEASCYICLESEDDGEQGTLFRSLGCACRGTMGIAHLQCLFDAANSMGESGLSECLFTQCPTCGQSYAGWDKQL